MMTLELLCARFTALHAEDLQRWIAEGYVRPEAADGDLVFQDIDVERVALILDLREAMAVNEDALPVVLSLLDQLYALRRRLRRLGLEPDSPGPDDEAG
ncbi:chaperone modulatory protein CbpM [Humitalea rosea]|uniref:Chaperone modulatory protein CbpM n=2 Tax=Humitalea rosea TaxID=990373 RepID=A0A2W7IGG4_9PROT|nr:chaperone modulatory protein CbpM [Humitalea rosea]